MNSVEVRLAVLETKYAATEKSLIEVNDKLDELLALRNKGMGVFWLASALLGTGIVGALTSILNWIK